MDADDPTENPVAPNLDNTFGPLIKRLPIGHSATSPLRSSLFRVWVPADGGGKLTVRHTAGGTVELQRPLGTSISKRQRVVEHVVKDGEAGWFYVKAIGAPVKVDCTFKQIGFARDGATDADPPLIPYNFWYWPTPQKFQGDGELLQDNEFAKRAADVLVRYGKLTGQNGTGGALWEALKHQKPTGLMWEGHCHHAAPASILFEAPATKTVQGIRFDKEEIEYLATEFFGNFGRLTPVWGLDKGLPRPARFPITAYFKPSASKRPEDLLRAIEPELGTDAAAKVAFLWQASLGGSESFELVMNLLYGTSASTLYVTLVNWMLRQKYALMGNMRTYDGQAGPEEVWNQSVFWYEATFKESAPVDDEKVVDITCRLFANQDSYPSTGLPAQVRNNETVPFHDKIHGSLLYVYTWRLAFEDNGFIKMLDKRNAWLGAKNDFNEDIFVATDFNALTSPMSSRWREIPGYEGMLGNPIVGQELLSLDLIKMRKRFSG